MPKILRVRAAHDEREEKQAHPPEVNCRSGATYRSFLFRPFAHTPSCR
jgi:hypothetical protein